MIEYLFGSADAERLLLFLQERERGYGREVADFWDTSVSGIQRQLDKLEGGGIIQGEQWGRTRVYTWNPRWPLLVPLRTLLAKAVELLPEDQRALLQENRRRPRRRGKPQ